MRYFSYNDYMDYSESGKIDKVVKVEERIEKYEVMNRTRKKVNNSNKIVEILKDKKQLQIFLNEFLNFFEIIDIEDIIYCNFIKSISDKDVSNNLICKSNNKEIYIFIKVIENIDVNISYKMLEHSINIIKRWEAEEKRENKRYPIVIPIILYTGKEIWKKRVSRTCDKINYVTFEENSINFSYNMINVNELNLEELMNMKSKVAKEIVNIRK